MKKTIFANHTIYSMYLENENINVNTILKEFNENIDKYKYTHYINDRWENIYLSPQYIPSILPLLSFISSQAINICSNKLKPHQMLIIPHELLGFEKNEFWFNIASKNQSTRMHNHINNAVISGVFYLKAPKDGANIIFNIENKKSLEIESTTNKLILFPSELDHCVPKNKSEEDRISLAFNCYKCPLRTSLSIDL